MELEPALQRLYGSVPAQRELIKLKGDASTRTYYRLRVEPIKGCSAPLSVIVMYLPEDYLRSDEIVSGPAPTELPFLSVQRLLKSRGVPVPEVLVDDCARRVLLLEDLGDETMRGRLDTLSGADWPVVYRQAIDLLARLHSTCREIEPGCIAFERQFDRDLLYKELDHFRQWGLEAVYGTLGSSDSAVLDESFQYLINAIDAVPKGFVHRDFQSRNLMYAPRGASESLVVIDFQDALIGPTPYDLASLLCDSYVDLDPAFQEELVAYYSGAAELDPRLRKAFFLGFWLVVLQRKLKDAGRFVFIDRVRGNSGFLSSYPPSLRYVGRALEKVEGLGRLRELFQRLIPGYPDQVPEPDPLRKTD
jgi:N-acetylmuramate 1-kinase